MQMAMESCPAKTVLAGGMGFALGGMFGLFMSSVRFGPPLSYDTLLVVDKGKHCRLTGFWRARV